MRKKHGKRQRSKVGSARHELRKQIAMNRRRDVMQKAKIHPTKGHRINRMSKLDRWAMSQDAKEKGA